ncbi:lanC-like protein 3 homolog [Anopheles bellator]|uniref:lanC-like protein 3 homolog n=1 Tax=Anopheles bellator TaxID=139047 RepID=UPI0026478387|nr:lanC-like protein 3 homolog [Anopheles bellator]
MSEERCFPNPFCDYNENVHGNSNIVSKETVLKLIKTYVDMILSKKQETQRDDLYVGAAGTAFMFWKLSRSPATANLYPCLDHAAMYIDLAKTIATGKGQSSKRTVAFLCGNAGIAAVSAVISDARGNKQDAAKDIEQFLEGFRICTTDDNCDDEVLVGRAGYLHGAYWLNQVVRPKPIANEDVEKVCEIIMRRGREYASKQRSASPLMYAYHDKEYLGAAHGVCAILHALLESRWFLASEDGKFKNVYSAKVATIKNSIDYVLSLQRGDGNLPTRADSDRMLVHWCHGASGAIYLLAKAYLTFKEERYLEGCRKCANIIWARGLLRKGPGICHGVAGNGYAFLLMYRLTGERRYLYRAQKFAEFLTTSTFSARVLAPDRPYSLYEGLSGTVCFLVDILDPTTASFPFMDVFESKVNAQ